MSNTIESTHNKIMAKINTCTLAYDQINSLIECFKCQGIDYVSFLMKNNIYYNILYDEFQQIESQYKLVIVSILDQYYRKINKYEEELITQDYYKTISSENFISKLEDFGNKSILTFRVLCKAYYYNFYANQLTFLEYDKPVKVEYQFMNFTAGNRVHNSPNATPSTDFYTQLQATAIFPILTRIYRTLGAITKITVDCGVPTSNEYCSCGLKLKLYQNNEMFCEVCNPTKTAYNQPEETQSDTIKKSNTCTYEPSRHFHFWIDRIQAKETKTFSAEDHQKIDHILVRDKIELNTVYDMRLVLRKCNLTKHNDHAPLLMKLKTGVSPPQLSFVMIKQLNIKFNKIIKFVKQIKGSQGNNPYYPYFIYKSIEIEIKKIQNTIDENTKTKTLNSVELKKLNDELSELKRFLQYIHLQNEETLSKHDLLYKEICKISSPEDGLVFSSTYKL